MFQEWIKLLNKADKAHPNWVGIWNACSNAFTDFELMMDDFKTYPHRSDNASTIWVELQKAMDEARKAPASSGYGSMVSSEAEEKITQEKAQAVAHERMDCFLVGFFNPEALKYFEDPITLEPFIRPVLISEHPEKTIKQTVSQSVTGDLRLTITEKGKPPREILTGLSRRQARTWPEEGKIEDDHLMIALLAWREVLQPLTIFCSRVSDEIRIEMDGDRRERSKSTGSDVDIYISTTKSLNVTLLRDAARAEGGASREKGSWGCCSLM